MRTTQNLDQQRRSREKRQTPFHSVDLRLGFVLVILLILALDQPYVINFWIAAGVIAAILGYRLIRCLYHRNRINHNAEPTIHTPVTTRPPTGDEFPRQSKPEIMPWDQ